MNETISEKVKCAGEFIRAGGLVAFPTETVYGLGADAFNSEAVARIYSSKGRPGDNPLILHIASADDFIKLAHNPPEYAFKLIEAYWPGPLTLVARKNPSLPLWLGGHPDGKTETIGIRMPAHPIAKALIKEADCVIAAPSANKAGKPSPTTLSHVLEDFPEFNREGSGMMALDGGSAIVGLESTVVDITGEHPIILRPGAITAEEIASSVYSVIPCLTRNLLDFAMDEGAADQARKDDKDCTLPRSPGMKYKHYAPRAEMTILSGESDKITAYILNECKIESKIGILVHEKTLLYFQNPPSNIKILSLGGDEKTIAQNLFSHLRKFDELKVDFIYAEAVQENGLGVAIMDRMRKAAEGRVINV